MAAKFENSTEDVTLHQSARPPFGWFEAGSGVGRGNSPSVPIDAEEDADSAEVGDAEEGAEAGKEANEKWNHEFGFIA